MAIEQQRLARPNPISARAPNPFGVQAGSGAGLQLGNDNVAGGPNPLQLFLGNLLGGGGGGGVNIANLIQQLRGMGIPGMPDIGMGWTTPGSPPNGGITGMPGVTPSSATPLTGNILPQMTPSLWTGANPQLGNDNISSGGPTPSPWTNLPMMGLSGGSGMVLG